MTRAPATSALLAVVAGVLCAGLVALGVWQVERLAWKRALIVQVDTRVRAAPVAAPGPAQWAAITAERDAYRHIVARGRYRDDHATLVQAVTERGPGFWVMTPLDTDRGFTVLVNRGFVPERGAVPPGGAAAVAGLLRLSEPGGAFLRHNDPVNDRWFSRDVAAIAAARGTGPVAPYFIDADATPGAAAKAPVGGLTVVRFTNNHLVYAITWFILAAMAAAGGVWLLREARRG